MAVKIAPTSVVLRPTGGQRRADEDGAEAVEKCADRLDREDEADVRHAGTDRYAIANQARMRRVTVRSPVATSVGTSLASAIAAIRMRGIGGP